MVIPSIALIRRELMLASRAPQFDKPISLVRVGTFDEQLDRVIALEFVGFHMALKFAFDTP